MEQTAQHFTCSAAGFLRQRASASVTIHSEPVVYTQRGSASGTIHSEPAVDPQRTPVSVTSPSEPAVYTYRVVCCLEFGLPDTLQSSKYL